MTPRKRFESDTIGAGGVGWSSRAVDSAPGNIPNTSEFADLLTSRLAKQADAVVVKTGGSDAPWTPQGGRMILPDGLDRGVTTDVTIFGRQYPVQSQESSEYTHRVADLVDRRMSEIASRQKLAEPTKIAIIAALDIADRLLNYRSGREAAGRQAERVAARLTMLLDDEDGGSKSA